jgi:hypothetical protein
MQYIILLLSVFSCSLIWGQQDYAKSLLDSLCHERYDGRGYVNNGDVRSGDFIIRELEKIGVQPFKDQEYAQPYQLNVNTFPDTMLVVIDQDTLVPGEEYLVQANSGSAKGSWKLEEINPSNYEKYLKESSLLQKLKKEGFIPLFNFTEWTDRNRVQSVREMARKAMRYTPVVWIEKNEQMFSVGRSEENFPLVSIDSADFSGGKTIELNIRNQYIPNYSSKNIIGCIPGKKKRKFIVFSAHYDHLGRMGSQAFFPGANDNASGVAMLLSLAKYYQEHPSKYSIVFCFFSGEEAGLVGSRYFVNHPYIKTRRIKFVLNVDIMGGASKGITLVNGTVHQKAFATFERINNEKNYLEKIKKRGPTANSDHYFFSQLGVPAFFIYSMGTVRNYHDVYDTAENTPLNRFNEVQKLLVDFVEEQ